ncbi:MAG TPA: hypothetical protein EYP67_04685 [Methanosarcinales archaeon]|nr:hypothetical protein [Methanosarcinales archaeon]
MKTRTIAGILLIALVVVSVGAVADNTSTKIEIDVAPSVLSLGSDGTWVTVHTDIALCEVACDTLTLNNIPVAWVESDDKGNLVAKFDQSEIKAIVAPPEATLTLTGQTNDGEHIEGSDIIRVIDCSG